MVNGVYKNMVAGLVLDCPQAGLGQPSANFAGPGPGPRGPVHPQLALARTPDNSRGSLVPIQTKKSDFGQKAWYQSGQKWTKVPKRPNRLSGQEDWKMLQHEHQSGQILAWCRSLSCLTPHILQLLVVYVCKTLCRF